MSAEKLARSGRYRIPQMPAGAEVRPAGAAELVRLLSSATNAQTPFRPRGAGTASTDCNTSTVGTIIDMSGFDRIINIDDYNQTVTAQAGVRLYALIEALAEHGLELVGNHELTGRTLGGAIAAPSFGPSIGNESAYFASQVESLKLVTASGKTTTIREDQARLLSAVRTSYGALGIITEATLKVRPTTAFSVTHRRLDTKQFCAVVDTLSRSDVGFKIALMPFRDRVFLDLRRYNKDVNQATKTPWRIKDWGESTVLPNVVRSLNRVLPIHSIRYRLIDSVGAATQGLVNSNLLRNGSNSVTSPASRSTSRTRRILSSTWCFPATDFSVVLRAYQDFCRCTYAKSHYRCDLPAIGYRLCKDSSALLSPSFDEPMIAVQTSSTQKNGWEDFVIDLADFAEHWAGIPIYSQSRALRADYARQQYSQRLELFRKIRRQLDPDNRLMTPFLTQYFA